MARKKGIERLKRKINAPIVVGLILLSVGAYYVSGTYLMTMFKSYPCIRFWAYRADPTTGKGIRLPNGTVVHGHGESGVKIEMWDSSDTPPIVPNGKQQSCYYTDDWGLTFFQFAFDVQVERVWHWKATFRDGKVYTGSLYLPKEGIDIYVFIEETEGLTHIYPADLLRVSEQEVPTVTAKVLINDVEAGDAPLYVKTSQITVKVIPSDVSRVTSIRATIDGNDIPLQRMDSYYIADLTLQDGRHVLKVYINEIEVASIGLRIDSNWVAKIVVGTASAVAGVICIFAGMRRK
ncbi:hypothetical protein DRN85_10605 [Methanosarcinales archaeon]|nr:MAG: hypothetical protein DRN85_10605 [Methanosarcinales archaeon]